MLWLGFPPSESDTASVGVLAVVPAFDDKTEVGVVVRLDVWSTPGEE